MTNAMTMQLSTPIFTVPGSMQTKTIAIGVTLLLHVALVSFITSNWTITEHKPVKIDSVKIQTYQLPKPVPVKVEPKKAPEPKPVEPVVVPKKPKPVEKKEFAFKRVEKKPEQAKPKPKPKPKPDKKVVKKVVEKTPPKPTPAPAVEQPVVTKQEPVTTPQATETVSAETKPFDVSQYHPVQKDAPDYPRSALRKGLEGDCTIEYTVTPKGTVDSPVVVGDCNVKFVKPSIEAAKKFRYAPRMVNGKAVAVPKVRNTFEYRIQ